MPRILANLLFTGFFGATSLLRAADPARLEPRRNETTPHVLTVRVYNYADVSPTTLKVAAREARGVFSRAGIETRWAICASPNWPSDDVCSRVATSLDLRVRIVPDDSGRLRHDQFGAALVPAEGRLGIHASIFWDRVSQYAVRWQAPEGLLLGHLIAHELGHLLLGADSHQPGGQASGIMAGVWGREQTARATRAGLRFEPHEARKMKEQLRSRAVAATRRR